jgi:broad-specificity NMP kinase
MTDASDVLFIGGRSGVGKSSVAAEMSAQLAAADAWHAVIEGDNLDMAHPPPWEHGLAERNLASMWRNYLDLGYRRLIYTNTNSVCSVEELVAAIGGRPRVVAVLLTAAEDTIRDRLAQREIGSALDEHVDRSRRAALRLEKEAPEWVVRVDTDARSVMSIADKVIHLADWH